MAGYALAEFGMVRLERIGSVRYGLFGCVVVRYVPLWQERLGVARWGAVGQGRVWQERHLLFNLITMYKYAVDRLYKVSAEDAGKELERIRIKYGTLKAEDVVEESKAKDSVLHSVFEWNNKEAADAWRINQAKALIRNVVVVIEKKEIKCKVRAFVSVAESPTSGASYVPINDALSNDYAKKYLMVCAKRDMESFVSKYRTLDELGGIISQMELFINE